MDRRGKIIRALPRAFLYAYEGTEQGGRIIRLSFRPDPKFVPADRESEVCRGLQGTMWIDAASHRFLRAEGTLVRGVNFGWGVLGHLDKGGHFSLRQTEVAPGTWRITSIDLHFTGSMLLFKDFNIDLDTQSSAFQRVADHLSLVAGADVLRASATTALAAR